MKTIIVTRHDALLEYLRELEAEGTLQIGFASIMQRATAEDVRGQRVIGVLPLHLAAEAARVIVVPLDVPEELRGVELTIDQVRQYARPPVEYSVCRVADVAPSDLDAMETSRALAHARR